jgi:hypothetical protein
MRPGAPCKTVGSAYDGSNPSPATTSLNGPWPAWMRSGADLVRVQRCPAEVGRCGCSWLFAITALSASDVWAVGHSQNGNVLHADPGPADHIRLIGKDGPRTQMCAVPMFKLSSN